MLSVPANVSAQDVSLIIEGFSGTTQFNDGDTISSGSVTFTFTTSTDVAFTCSLNRNGDVQTAPCGSGQSGNTHYSLSDGEYVFSVIAQPIFGNAIQGFIGFTVNQGGGGGGSLADISGTSNAIRNSPQLGRCGI